MSLMKIILIIEYKNMPINTSLFSLQSCSMYASKRILGF